MKTQNLVLSEIAYLTANFKTHILPVLGFLSELEAQGMKYDVYGPPTLVKKLFESPDRTCFTFEELEWKEDGTSTKGLLKAALDGLLHTVSAIEDIWKEGGKKPKLIIADFCAPYAQYLAKKHNIPLLVFYAVFFPNGSSISEILKEFKQNFIFSMDESLFPLADQVEREYGVSIKSMKDILVVGDQNISCLPKFVGELISPENENSHYIGPGYRDATAEDEKSNFDNNVLKGKDLIYVSLGTFAMNAVGLTSYKTIIEAFKGTEHKVLISGLEKTEELIAEGLPKNIIVKSWVPQIKVLKHSKLFISHVGAGSFIEALGKGVPIVAIPNFADQFINSVAVEKLNVGRWVKDRSPENIRKIVEEVLNDESIRENCKKFKEMIDSKASRSRFIEIVKSMMKQC